MQTTDKKKKKKEKSAIIWYVFPDLLFSSFAMISLVDI